jgi:CrcB protein
MLLLSGPVLMPWGTILSNLLACVIFGLVVHRYGPMIEMQPSLKAFLLIGFCGGFSTFSSFGFESFQLIKQGHPYFALANILISVVLCTAIFFVLVRKMDV